MRYHDLHADSVCHSANYDDPLWQQSDNTLVELPVQRIIVVCSGWLTCNPQVLPVAFVAFSL